MKTRSDDTSDLVRQAVAGDGAAIEELFARNITGGCQAQPPLYCPNNANNRGQMAVFLVKTFQLLLYGFPAMPI